MPKDTTIVPRSGIEHQIHLIRGHRVMLSSDLAELYEVQPKALVQAVKRNIGRFPDDFMFQLTNQEVAALKSQNVTFNPWWIRRAPPYAFTEQGVAMLSSVLKSKRAVFVNIEIMRAFVRLRQILISHADLTARLDALEKRYDDHFKIVFDAIRKLMEPPPLKQKKIGFIQDDA